jgi:small ligand-binding sensory domain FIST
VAGAADSCAEALDGLGGKTPLGVLAFDCAGRRRKLGPDGVLAEMAAMRTALGSTPYAGFYTTAEIARVRGALGIHHLTLVTMALA